MIWQIAQVVDSGPEALRVRISAPEHCQRCARGAGCGAGVFSGLFARRDTQLTLPAEAGLAPEEWVRIGVTPQALAAASFAHYGLGLLGLLVGAWLGQRFAPRGFEDVTALFAGLAGLILLVGPVGRRLPRRLNPVVERLSCSQGDAKSSSISS